MRSPRLTAKPPTFEGLTIIRSARGWLVCDGEKGRANVAGPFETRDEAVTARNRRVREIRAERGTKPRPCMCCAQVFDSHGRFHRLCPVCSARAGGLPVQMAG